MYTPKKRRFSPLLLIGISVPVLLVMIAGGVLAVQKFGGANAAAAVNMNCTLTVPPNPLTAQGLATPYQLAATNAANGPCNEANPNQAAFVQAAILDPATGQISAYEPLVIDKGTQPAIAPVVPTLPANAVVGIWFGFNGTTLPPTPGIREPATCPPAPRKPRPVACRKLLFDPAQQQGKGKAISLRLDELERLFRPITNNANLHLQTNKPTHP